MTRHADEIFSRLDDPVEKQKVQAKKKREDIINEKVGDYNL